MILDVTISASWHWESPRSCEFLLHQSVLNLNHACCCLDALPFRSVFRIPISPSLMGPLYSKENRKLTIFPKMAFPCECMTLTSMRRDRSKSLSRGYVGDGFTERPLKLESWNLAQMQLIWWQFSKIHQNWKALPWKPEILELHTLRLHFALKDYHFVAKADQHSSMMGPQIIGWANHGPINDSFHGNSEKWFPYVKTQKKWQT